jgi:GDYXXLXY protein
MNRKALTIIAIVLQFIVLTSFIVRYEALKQTGTAVYIPLMAYDPTDMFRGEYVSLSYALPYTGSIDSYSSKQQYLIPELDGKVITKVVSISTTEPESGIYFQVRNGWMRESTQIYTLDTGSGKIIELPSSYCQTE